MTAGHWHVLTKIFRFTVPEGEAVMKVLAKEGIADNTRYIFKGWPRLQGERIEDVCPGHL